MTGRIQNLYTRLIFSQHFQTHYRSLFIYHNCDQVWISDRISLLSPQLYFQLRRYIKQLKHAKVCQKYSTVYIKLSSQCLDYVIKHQSVVQWTSGRGRLYRFQKGIRQCVPRHPRNEVRKGLWHIRNTSSRVRSGADTFHSFHERSSVLCVFRIRLHVRRRHYGLLHK